MSLAYSLTERSDENFPIRAMVRIIFRAQTDARPRKSCAARAWVGDVRVEVGQVEVAVAAVEHRVVDRAEQPRAVGAEPIVADRVEHALDGSDCRWYQAHGS